MDKNGSPSISILVAGAFSAQPTEFQAILDTGFSGFLSMPLIRAFPLGLPLRGTTTVSLADGKSHEKLMAMAEVTVGGDTHFGLVILEPSSTDILVGMDFLRTFGVALVVSDMGVMLFEEKALKEVVDKLATQAAKKQRGEEPPPTETSD